MAVDDVLVAVADRARLQQRRIRARRCGARSSRTPTAGRRPAAAPASAPSARACPASARISELPESGAGLPNASGAITQVPEDLVQQAELDLAESPARRARRQVGGPQARARGPRSCSGSIARSSWSMLELAGQRTASPAATGRSRTKRVAPTRAARRSRGRWRSPRPWLAFGRLASPSSSIGRVVVAPCACAHLTMSPEPLTVEPTGNSRSGRSLDRTSNRHGVRGVRAEPRIADPEHPTRPIGSHQWPQHLDRLTAVDASFLQQEGPTSHMHVGAVIDLRGPAAAVRRVPRRAAGAAAPRPALPPEARPPPLGRPAAVGRRPRLQPRVPRPPDRAAQAGLRGAAHAARRADHVPAARPHQAAVGGVARRGPQRRPAWR